MQVVRPPEARTRSVPCGVITTRVRTLIYVVNSNDRNKVLDAKEELIKMIEDEMRAVVVAVANTLIPSTATRLGKKLTDMRKKEDLCWWYADGGRRRQCFHREQSPATGKVTSLLAATLGLVVAGRMDVGDLGVALPCASAKRARLLPEVFDDWSYVGRRLSLRDTAIIGQLSETAFCC